MIAPPLLATADLDLAKNLTLPLRSFTSHCCVELLLNSMLLVRVISSRPSSRFFLVLVELGAGETDPDPGRHVAAVVVALAELGVVVDFNFPLLLVFISRQFDDSDSSCFGLLKTVGTKPLVGQRVEGLVAF